MSYADVSELEARWRPLTQEEQERASVLLCDASAMLDALVGDREVPTHILCMVACGMVQRAMSANADAFGLTQQTMTAGPYSQSWSYSNPSGDFYLTKAERQMLGLGRQKAYSIRPQVGRCEHAPWH